MPILIDRAEQSPPTHVFLPVSSSEAVSLKGHKAKTPIIAGSICGSLLFLAWLIGFTTYFLKRRKKKQGKLVSTPKKKAPQQPEPKYIIPPDPAIVLGHRRPGDSAFKEEEKHPEGDGSLKPSQTLPDNVVLKANPDSRILGDIAPLTNTRHASAPSKIEGRQVEDSEIDEVLVVPSR